MTVTLGTVLPIGFSDFQPGELLACYRQLGCRVVQVYRSAESAVSPERMRAIVEEGQLTCDSIHGLYGEDFDPSAPEESARQAAIEAFKQEGELVLRLGGDLVVVHCSSVRREGVSDAERRRRLDQLRRSVAELGAFGAGCGVRYAFENLPAYHPVGSDVAELARLLEDIVAPNTGMCLDTGHAHMVGDAAQAVREGDGQILYVHFSDNFGLEDDHEMPTYGTLPAEAVGRAIGEIGYDGVMMLEVFQKPAVLRRLIDEGCAERLAKILDIANAHSPDIA